MRQESREKFNAYAQKIAQLNGIESTGHKFHVSPQQEEKLEEKVRESAGFLSRINVMAVENQSGRVIGLDAGDSIAGTTDTSGTGERQTSDPTTSSAHNYFCSQTNYDSHIRYELIDAWRHKPEFQLMLRNVVNKQIARDRLKIGFNGISRAENSDRTANPLLQDVSRGWLQFLRDNDPSSAISGIKVGDAAGADYKNIDAAVSDSAHQLIHEAFEGDSRLVVIMGRDLLHDKYLGLTDDSNIATEKAALDLIMTNKVIGGLRVVTAPYFPAKAFFITMLDNISIYFQRGSTRRHIIDNPKKDQIEDYRSVNDDFVLENTDAAGLVEGILVPDGAGGWE